MRKFNGTALRYKVTIFIGQGNVVFANGLFMAGANYDPKIIKLRQKNEHDYRELVITVRSHSDLFCVVENSEKSSIGNYTLK